MAQSCSLLSSSASRTTSTIDLVVQLVNLLMIRITAPGGLLLGHSRLGSHLVEVVVHHAHLLLALHFGSLDRLVLTSQVASSCGLKMNKWQEKSWDLFDHAAVFVRLFQQRSCLFESVLVHAAPVFSQRWCVVQRCGYCLFCVFFSYLSNICFSSTIFLI